MKRGETVKILVAERSAIIRAGVVSLVRRELGTLAVTQEAVGSQDFATRLRSMMPDVVMMSPELAKAVDMESLRADKTLGLDETRFVAIASRLEPTRATRDFAMTLNIFDDDETLARTLAQVAMRDEEPQAATDTDTEPLSTREREVVRGVVRGLSNKEIADEMSISLYTVLTHRRNISRKLQIHSPVALAIYAITNKIATTEEVK